ncbi:unnamed protein product [Anisakis simplex]|uniref:Acyl-CoA dehydrogenase family member 9, mitochondrial (inferred by orthology to a human protein) n=1 Tax=Anisakis simplex TaxID=6269 RepID=A0A0M3J495_ANISI|nr:unnamed protein product [Anisakis simplex]
MKANDTTLSDTVLAVLKRNALSSANVPAEYEGMGMCNKDLLCLSEVLGLDFNVYMRLLQIQRAVTVITLYGSEEQKQTLLPKIASGALKPAILLFDENGNFDFESIQTSAIASGDGVEKISGTKSSVIGVADANLFLVFAMRKSNLQQKGNMACYIIEREHLPQQSCLTINSRINTLGLNALHVSDVELKDVPVNSSSLLGSVNDSRDIALELSASNGYTYGAAVVGFLKLLIGELSHFCNTTIQFKSPLSENLGIQVNIDIFSKVFRK